VGADEHLIAAGLELVVDVGQPGSDTAVGELGEELIEVRVHAGAHGHERKDPEYLAGDPHELTDPVSME
jgi:hypothetical protein